jgi:hypothetical protein
MVLPSPDPQPTMLPLPSMVRPIPPALVSTVPMQYLPPVSVPVSGTAGFPNHSIATIPGVQPAAWQQYPVQTTLGISVEPPNPMQTRTLPPAAMATKPVSTYTPFLDHAYMGVAMAMQSHAIQPIMALPAPHAPDARVGEVTQSHDAMNAVDCDIIQHRTQILAERNVQRQPILEQAADEMPDFLSGFDQVKKSSPQKLVTPPSTIQAEVDPSQFSPTFTSRSFDDFHRLLGTNLSPLGKRRCTDLPIPDVPVTDLLAAPASGRTEGLQDHTNSITSAVSAQPHQSSQEMLQRAYGEAISWESRLPSTSNSADSYTIFAQQGAFAASQHSAYFSAKGDSDGDDLSMLLMGIKQKPHYESTSKSGDGWLNFSLHRRVEGSHPAQATVSAEPSDQGSDEANQGSGTDSNPTDGSNDSDESYSDVSRKKARIERSDDTGLSSRAMHWGRN